MSRLDKMLASHPRPAANNGAEAKACIEACFGCAEICSICADACLAENDISHLRACIRLNLDCADICDVTGRLLVRTGHRDAKTLTAQLQACIQACTACTDECVKHAEGMQMEHCGICADACRRCAAACEVMVNAIAV